MTTHFNEAFPLACPGRDGLVETIKVGTQCDLRVREPNLLSVTGALHAAGNLAGDLFGLACDGCAFSGRITVEAVGSNSFRFESGRGHTEGQDRHIEFTIYRDATPGYADAMRVNVTAWGPRGGMTANDFLAERNKDFVTDVLWGERLAEDIAESMRSNS